MPFNREYKWSITKDTENVFGLGLAIGNLQPKSKYKTAQWVASILIICFSFEIELMYNYKNK